MAKYTWLGVTLQLSYFSSHFTLQSKLNNLA
jgi:hypothetical protein